MKTNKKIDTGSDTIAANTNATATTSPEEAAALRQMVMDANSRESEKLPTRGAGVNPAEVHSSAKQVKNAHRKLAAKGLAGSLRAFVKEQIAQSTSLSEDAKTWQTNKVTLACQSPKFRPKVVKVKEDKKAA